MAKAAHESKIKLLDATLKVVRAKGYTATRVEDVCAEAGLTKGSFFHHFRSKDELALAAVAHWGTQTTELFADAPYHQHRDPLKRVLAYLDFRKAILVGALPEFTCFVGTIVQEAYLTHPEINAACEKTLLAHAKTLQVDIREAMRKYGVRGHWTAESLALHIQAAIQGAFILAKARGSATVAAESIDHLRRYLELLFRGGNERRRPGVAEDVAGGGGSARRSSPVARMEN
jgi:TetR/AcrR family transcriptional regulator, transcriptional repressor for nem operon